MSLLAKIASLRQVNINAHAEIEALKEEVKARIWCDAQSNTEIEALKYLLADDDRSVFSTHEHHRELRDKLNAEIKTLTEKHQREHDSRMCDNDEEEERVDKICSALGLDATDGFTHPETNEAILDEINTLSLSLADRDEEVKTLKEECGVLQDCSFQLITQNKALRAERQRFQTTHQQLHAQHNKLHDKNDTLKLSLADRDEEVKTLKDEVEKQTILANSYRDTTEEYYEEKKELRCKQKTQATIISGMAKKITELQENVCMGCDSFGR